MAAAEFGGGIAEGFDHLLDGGDLAGADAYGADRGGLGAAGDAVEVGQRKGAQGVTARGPGSFGGARLASPAG
ncbi:hypothetical protein GCM10010315_10030 [Streptomyces luteosporeus]|uniref:Uncharacterized protein n=1 Tax=Streptomyces luteosporeus TaxID=173856 RepID=A0ABP6G0F8_9ACTN